MSKQPKALQLADLLITPYAECNLEAAAELRRLHQSETEGWRYAAELEQERKRLHEVNQELLEALKGLAKIYDAMGEPRGPTRIIADAAIAKAGEQP